MLNSTDNILHKPIENKLNIQTCPYAELLLTYLIRTNFREALISRFSRFVENREIKDSLKLGYAKIKHAKFNRVCALSRNEILNQKPCIG